MRYYLELFSTVVGLMTLGPNIATAQTTNNLTVPNNATSTANPQSNLNQQGALVNTQVNTHPLGRSVVGKGIADCTSSGIAASMFGSGIGPFDNGSIGGTFTYTHSFGMGTCKKYAKTQLGRAQLETCLLLISNYSKMVKAGIEVSYDALQEVANIDCPSVTVRPAQISTAAFSKPQPLENALGDQRSATAQPKQSSAVAPQNP